MSLYRDNSRVCEWGDSIQGPEECGTLIVDKDNGLIIYNATISKPTDKNFETLLWVNRANEISVTLDWTNSGEAPEVKACGKSDD
ncbi:unnamed protein product [Hymenolepis diminuta]|uniref:DUF5727 domain-containing protein n=1 Tax=Hymenolepis diminuta TaxID=6216 RepID=A0A0R3SLL4_HYMDI|nr:unnamed protein product [Hymenolepis diminuta]